MAWRVANSLDMLLAEVNALAPRRSTVSDGSIGDAEHATRDSDHNPWVIDPDGVGVVRARDITHDPSKGCDAGRLAERVRHLGLGNHPALGAGAYVIWNRRIASATDDGRRWDWEPYGGSNPHDHHVHISVALALAGYDSRRAWLDRTGAPVSDAYQIVSFRGWTFDRMTVAWIEAVEAKLGGTLVIFQDSYNEGVDQSVGTHDRGGAVDCAPPPGKTFADLLRAARSCAGFGWVRDPSQGDWQWHFHGGPLGHERQAELLDLQEQGYRQHRNGLGPWPFGPDPTWHPDPIPKAFRYPPAPEDDMPQYDDPIPLTDGKTFGDALRSDLRTEEKVDRLVDAVGALRSGSAERDAKQTALLREIDSDLDVLAEQVATTADIEQVRAAVKAQAQKTRQKIRTHNEETS